MSPTIERATIDDIEDLLPLIAAYRTFYECAPQEHAERAFMREHLSRGTSAVFIARDGARAVGFVQMFPAFSTVGLGPSLILEDLFVAPEVRRAGVATALLERAIAYAREIGAVGMFLETARDNDAAQAVYERAGWMREGRFFKYNARL